MSFEGISEVQTTPAHPAERTEPSPEQLAERRKRLRETTGISLSAKTKEGAVVPLDEQFRLASELGPGTVQFDFRHRTLDEIAGNAEAFSAYRSEHPAEILSMHGDTPQIDAVRLRVANKEKLVFESKLSEALGAESYTVHPPNVSDSQWQEAPADSRRAVLDSFLEVFDDAVRASAEDGRQLAILIENMPAKGPEGTFGQTPQQLSALIEAGEQRLALRNIRPSTRAFGVTLDVNHALHGKKPEEAAAILQEWFAGLSDVIRVVHLYAASESTASLQSNYDIVLDLASRFSPDARILVESKQSDEATRRAFNAVKETE